MASTWGQRTLPAQGLSRLYWFRSLETCPGKSVCKDLLAESLGRLCLRWSSDRRLSSCGFDRRFCPIAQICKDRMQPRRIQRPGKRSSGNWIRWNRHQYL